MLLTQYQIRLLVRLSILIVVYFFLRLGFYLYHFEIYSDVKTIDILKSFLWGIRFDIAGICILNSFFAVVSLLRIFNLKAERCFYLLLNFLGILASINDYELFQFVGKRLSYDFFVISGDIWKQLPQITLYYWYLPLVASVILIGAYFVDKKLFSVSETKQKLKLREGTISVFILGLLFVGIRGGLQYKSINIQSAFIQGDNKLGHLVLNTPYHFLRTLKNKSVQRLSYFKNKDEIKVLRKYREFLTTEPRGKNNLNVVLLILESFSMEYFEQGYMPFLKELSEQSLFFEKHLANGRKSIESLPSILCALPSLLDEPISKSIFGGNKFSCLPQILKENGYDNSFYHAGARGTMGFESFTLSHGFSHYFSKEDYPLNDHFDGAWGIYDGPYLKYVAEELDEKKEPFLAGIFTLSSHQPYSIPSEFKNKFPKGSLEIHESIGYVDFSLKEFFKKIENKSWYKNTLFVITADHAQKLSSKKYQNIIGYYRVPLILFSPELKLQGTSQKVTQHSDIPKTVLDLLNITNVNMSYVGESALNPGEGMAINYVDGKSYYLIQNDRLFILEKSGEQKKFHYNWSDGKISGGEATGEPLLKAYLQYFINGLLDNNLSEEIVTARTSG